MGDTLMGFGLLILVSSALLLNPYLFWSSILILVIAFKYKRTEG